MTDVDPRLTYATRHLAFGLRLYLASINRDPATAVQVYDEIDASRGEYRETLAALLDFASSRAGRRKHRDGATADLLKVLATILDDLDREQRRAES